MRKTIIAFILLTSILILGILVMIKPHFFISYFQKDKLVLNQPALETKIPKEIILLASLLIIIGLIGLSVLGFKLFKGLQDEENTKVD